MGVSRWALVVRYCRLWQVCMEFHQPKNRIVNTQLPILPGWKHLIPLHMPYHPIPIGSSQYKSLLPDATRCYQYPWRPCDCYTPPVAPRAGRPRLLILESSAILSENDWLLKPMDVNGVCSQMASVTGEEKDCFPYSFQIILKQTQLVKVGSHGHEADRA